MGFPAPMADHLPPQTKRRTAYRRSGPYRRGGERLCHRRRDLCAHSGRRPCACHRQSRCVRSFRALCVPDRNARSGQSVQVAQEPGTYRARCPATAMYHRRHHRLAGAGQAPRAAPSVFRKESRSWRRMFPLFLLQARNRLLDRAGDVCLLPASEHIGRPRLVANLRNNGRLDLAGGPLAQESRKPCSQ